MFSLLPRSKYTKVRHRVKAKTTPQGRGENNEQIPSSASQDGTWGLILNKDIALNPYLHSYQEARTEKRATRARRKQGLGENNEQLPSTASREGTCLYTQ